VLGPPYERVCIDLCLVLFQALARGGSARTWNGFSGCFSRAPVPPAAFLVRLRRSSRWGGRTRPMRWFDLLARGLRTHLLGWPDRNVALSSNSNAVNVGSTTW